MSVYVDDAKHPFGRMKMAHLLADTEAELHEFAARLGLKRSWFQGGRRPHYDVCKSKRRAALKAGALPIDGPQLRDLLMRTRADYGCAPRPICRAPSRTQPARAGAALLLLRPRARVQLRRSNENSGA